MTNPETVDSNIPPHVHRMQGEHTKLVSNIQLITDFTHSNVFSDLGGNEQGLLIDQRALMRAYAAILHKRIVIGLTP